MTTLSYTASGHRLNWLGPSTVLSAGLLLHFAISTLGWVSDFFSAGPLLLARGLFLNQLAAAFTLYAPALILLATSAVAFIRGLHDRRGARRLILIVLLAAAAFFSLDVRFHRYQVAIDGPDGGFHQYYNWWWYVEHE